ALNLFLSFCEYLRRCAQARLSELKRPALASRSDRDRHVFVGGRRSVVGARAQDVRAGDAERDLRRHSAVARHRWREPHRCPRGVGSDAQVFPRFDLRRIELHRTRTSEVEPREMQAVALTDAALSWWSTPEVYWLRHFVGC